MDPRTGDIYQIAAENQEALEALMSDAKLIPLTDEQYKKLEPVSRPKRKNLMRNQPCVCGSGRKFKRCCWSEFA